ncbi:uncharacterized protein LOC105664208 [Megachile rotundata]|uniref:uncharacterized protein LOC105664208 n=1 Tax=Megachile rotundata TaxID=143995 RepID=UPI003FCF94D7
MDPGEVPDELKGLSLVEELVISLIHPQVKVYRVKGSVQLQTSGNIISFPQDVSSFATTLPHQIQNIPLVFVSKITEKDGIRRVRDFKIRVDRVRDALFWLKNNNPLYRDVTLSEDNFHDLSVEENVHQRIQHLSESVELSSQSNEIETNDQQSEEFSSDTFVPEPINFSSEAEIMANVHIQYPVMSSTPIDEFNTPNFIPAAFPTLFPYGKPCMKDPTRQRLTPKSFFLKLLRYKDNRFAKHPSFRFFALNIIQRWESVAQGNVFIQRNDLQTMSLDEIKERIRTDRNFLKRVMSYSSSIPGTDSFWFKKAAQRREMIEQFGMPSLFFTLSFADLQDPDLLGILRKFTNDQTSGQAKLIKETPLLVD